MTIKPVGPGGPMIVDGAGNLVWFRQLTPPEVAANLRLQKFKRRKVLTWWEGTVTPAAFGVGGGVIANRAYNVIKVVHAGNGYPMDLHEFQLTKDGDALFTVYSPIRSTCPGTPEGTLSPLLDAIVQEVDIRPGSSSGNGTPTATSPSRRRRRPRRTAPPTTPSTSTRSRP